MKITCKADPSELQKMHDAINKLDSVEYGWDDKYHSGSGLPSATLAAIHNYGWGNVPARHFMESAAENVLSTINDQMTARLIRHIARNGGPALSVLKQYSKKAEECLKMTLLSGDFLNPKVSEYWAEVKGFDDAMIYTGELIDNIMSQVKPTRR